MIDTKALREKVLELAIRGKLVPQDPRDEPASVLLERIRAEKQQMVKDGKLKPKDIKNDTIIFKGEDNLHYEQFGENLPNGWVVTNFETVLSYEQPAAYIVHDTNYSDDYKTPVLTAGKSFVLGYTDETDGVFSNLPVIIFDDFTTDNRLIDFPFKVKSSAMKILHINQKLILPKFAYYLMQATKIDHDNHQRYWISTFSKEYIALPPLPEQIRIIVAVEKIFNLIQLIDDEKTELDACINLIKSKILDLAIRGKLVPQDPNDEPASVFLERIRAEKEELIKQGKIKRDKKESVIFKGEDNSYYEKYGDTITCIDNEIPFKIPDGWIWCRLQDICTKDIKRGKAPKYSDLSDTIVFAQKCNTKTGLIDVSKAKYLDDTTLKKYLPEDFLHYNDIIINSTGTGTLGRIGIFRKGDNTRNIKIVPDSHITTVRVSSSNLNSLYVYYFLKYNQSHFEDSGVGSTNQKELKPETVSEFLIAIPPLDEQTAIITKICALFSSFDCIEATLK